jgi:hypothetical protein
MSEIINVNHALPTTIDDLSKFVLVGREKLVAVRAEIRAIDKVGLAQEVRQQKLQEAQDIAEAVLDAEVRIGELMREVPKQNTHNRSANRPDNGVQSKTEIIENAGFTVKQVQRFETLAAHPEIVEQAKAEAREKDDIVSRSLVLEKVKAQKQEETEQYIEQEEAPKDKPHVANNSGNNEWYTPADYIEAAREVMGSIDIDPASNDIAQETVKAAVYYTAETNGLDKEWRGNVWMNPPYASDLIGKFIDKLVGELPNIEQAIVLVNNATETEWFGKLISRANAVCFPRSRVKFYMPDGKTGAPLQGQAVIYFGEHKERFAEVFSGKGWCAIPV